MTWTVAIAGKGGTGKTTLSSLLIRALMRLGKGPVLAVDADPDANLHTGLGVKVNKTMGQVQQEWLDQKLSIPPGMPKQQYLLLQLNQAIEEKKNFDLITMGRPQGSGCYCSANSVLRDFVDKLKGNYSFLVVDNEAGMEHMSRKTIEGIDVLLMVSDPTPVGIRTSGRLIELAGELKLGIPLMGLVVNRVWEGLPKQISDQIAGLGINLLGTVPLDDTVADCSLNETSLLDLPDENAAAKAVDQVLERVRSSRNAAAARP